MNQANKHEALSQSLLTWYDEHKRILPWRNHPTPYAVWVSEIMLQQTRVAAVMPYYERFMKALPDLPSLARCEEDLLIKLWEGLGYYNRVRNMKRCAQICVERYHGTLPASYELLKELPGIGAYTAGAIASIAYQIPVCAVDGNILRVFSRVLCLSDDITKERTKRKFEAMIQDYLPLRCDAFNQALMELGALICLPNGAPHCHECPLSAHCLAYARGMQAHFPVKSPKAKRKQEDYTVLVMISNHRVHLEKRKETGLLAGLYQFDLCSGTLSQKQAEDYASHYGEVRQMIPLAHAVHIFTHKEWHMSGWLIYLADDVSPSGTWANVSQLKEAYAIPNAFKVYREAALAVLEGMIYYE